MVIITIAVDILKNWSICSLYTGFFLGLTNLSKRVRSRVFECLSATISRVPKNVYLDII